MRRLAVWVPAFAMLVGALATACAKADERETAASGCDLNVA
jgi:hypothetical protein